MVMFHFVNSTLLSEAFCYCRRDEEWAGLSDGACGEIKNESRGLDAQEVRDSTGRGRKVQGGFQDGTACEAILKMASGKLSEDGVEVEGKDRGAQDVVEKAKT
jgi:hypothetical protein